MEIKEVIGIDVSKLTLDVHLHRKGCAESFANTGEGMAEMLVWAQENLTVPVEVTFFVFEHTGLYSDTLEGFLDTEKLAYRIVPGLEIKRSLGIARGKDDRADAKRIALYGWRTRDEVGPSQRPDGKLVDMKRLMSLRRKMVAQRAGHITTLGEQRKALGGNPDQLLYKAQETVIDCLGEQIASLDREMDNIIAQDGDLGEMFALLLSVKGIGKVTARFLMVYTNGFQWFATWRKFASYVGIAPFPNTSGTSLRGRPKVNGLANKEGKALLNMCACTAVQYSNEMKRYYERRIGEGKDKMSTMNIIRNKLLSRAFAVVRRGTPYVDTMKFSS
jgi:transposase